jgi:hypothetical protein
MHGVGGSRFHRQNLHLSKAEAAFLAAGPLMRQSPEDSANHHVPLVRTQTRALATGVQPTSSPKGRTMQSKIKNILIVDNDLGFIFWLGNVLVDAGYQAWPVCNPSDAISGAGRKLAVQPDLLIVNASLPVVPELIAHYRRTQADLKVMALGPQSTTLPGVSAWRPTPGLTDNSAKREWVRAVKQMSGRQKVA